MRASQAVIILSKDSRPHIDRSGAGRSSCPISFLGQQPVNIMQCPLRRTIQGHLVDNDSKCRGIYLTGCRLLRWEARLCHR